MEQASPQPAADIAAWLAAIESWNRRIDLTAARSVEELVDLMVADAALLASKITTGSVVDVGSGAGAPGLPLAILRPTLSVDLVEPMQKRTTFLRMMLGKLALTSRVKVIEGRGESLKTRYDAAISRATLEPEAWLSLAARVSGGLATEVWVLLAKRDAPAAQGWTLAEEHRYTWPLTGAERRALRYVRA